MSSTRGESFAMSARGFRGIGPRTKRARNRLRRREALAARAVRWDGESRFVVRDVHQRARPEGRPVTTLADGHRGTTPKQLGDVPQLPQRVVGGRR